MVVVEARQLIDNGMAHIQVRDDLPNRPFYFWLVHGYVYLLPFLAVDIAVE